jgi:metal-responsive CopG/Arc/MetJ family transcriptional regulator
MYNLAEVLNMPTDKKRIIITPDEELFKLIDDYRFDNRFPSRSEAVTDLIRRGLESIKADSKSEKQNG